MNRSNTFFSAAETRFSTYALAVTAGVGILTGAQVAQADILAFATGTFDANSSPFALGANVRLTLQAASSGGINSGSFEEFYHRAGLGGAAVSSTNRR